MNRNDESRFVEALGSESSCEALQSIFDALLDYATRMKELPYEFSIFDLVNFKPHDVYGHALFKCLFYSRQVFEKYGYRNIGSDIEDKLVIHDGLLYLKEDEERSRAELDPVIAEIITESSYRLGLFLINWYCLTSSDSKFDFSLFGIYRWAITEFRKSNTIMVDTVMRKVLGNEIREEFIPKLPLGDKVNILYPNLKVKNIYKSLARYIYNGEPTHGALYEVAMAINFRTNFRKIMPLGKIDISNWDDRSRKLVALTERHKLAACIYHRLTENNMIDNIPFYAWVPDAWILYYIMLAQQQGYKVFLRDDDTVGKPDSYGDMLREAKFDHPDVYADMVKENGSEEFIV